MKLLLFLILTFAGPLWMLVSGKVDLQADFRTANRESAHLAPDPKTVTEAIVQIYAAQSFSWRGMFAVHTWIASKEKNSDHYVVYQVIGWRVLRGLSALSVESDIPDRYWFDHKPKIIFDLRGPAAEKIIPNIVHAAQTYPYPNYYDAWPGPNSNTFTAHVVREIPELNFALPSNALGKDYLSDSRFWAQTPSKTGYQFSLKGYYGITIAKKEGFELNLLGLVYGVGFNPFVIKLPGFGDISIKF